MSAKKFSKSQDIRSVVLDKIFFYTRLAIFIVLLELCIVPWIRIAKKQTKKPQTACLKTEFVLSSA